MEALGCKQQHGLHCLCTTEHIVTLKKHRKKNVVDAKSYRGGPTKQKRAQYFDKLKFICGKGPNELASLACTTIPPSISYSDIGYAQIVSPKST